MKELNAAINSRLSGDATLQALATGGAHLLRAPDEAAAPYCVFGKLDGNASYTFSRLACDDLIYYAKGVAHDWDAAADIAARAAELLTDQEAALPLAGDQRVAYIRRQGSIDYINTEAGVDFYNVGFTFRIMVTPS